MNRYQQAGVDVTAGYEMVQRIKKNVAATKRTGVMGGFGSFGGLFDLGALNLAAGEHNITFVYAGDDTYNAANTTVNVNTVQNK